VKLTNAERGFLRRIREWTSDFNIIRSDAEELILTDLLEKDLIEIKTESNYEIYIRSKIKV